MPFDGVAISMPDYSFKVQTQTPISVAQFQAELAPVAATHFTTLTHNFIMVNATPAGSFFASYAVPIQNFATLAPAARAAGFVGIVYDDEPYQGAVWDQIPGYTLAQSQTQALVRGQQTMDAMRAAWPTIQVLAFLGPAWSAPPTRWPTMGSFFVGMAQSAVGTAAKVIDGGELYALRTPADFAQAY